MSIKTYSKHFQSKVAPQSEAIPTKPMVANSAGGFSFAVDMWKRLDRFLILGSDSGTYYIGEKKLTQENAKCVLDCAAANPSRTVGRIVEIRKAGRAPKNDPAVFAIALLAAQKAEDRNLSTASILAQSAMSQICETGTQMFQFVEAWEALGRGWGRSIKRTVQNWYTGKDAGKMAYQCLKYQQREGWSHKDIMHLCHLRARGMAKEVQHWVEKGWDSVGSEPHDKKPLQQIWAFERLKREPDEKLAIKYIGEYNLTREMLPTQLLNSPAVWEAMLDNNMPMEAMCRNLATMTSIGLLKPLSSAARKVQSALANIEQLRKSRLHPIKLLVAQKIYAQGHGDKSSKTWTPVQSIVDSLDAAFYDAFGNVEASNKRWLLGIDVSGSMSARIAGLPLSCCEAASALTLVTTRTEPYTFVGRFNCGFEQVPFTNRSRLDGVLRYTQNINGGGTDCAMPMVYALQNKIEVDTFVVLTDNETWAGNIHPCQALVQYRQKMGIPAKLIVVAMTSNGFTIADPSDSGMLDCVGFDTATPQVMSQFSAE